MQTVFPRCFSIKAKDDITIKKSSSGGFFTVIATKVLEQGGVVYGAMFDEEFHVIHKGIDKIDDLHKLRGSKYVQSKIGDTFSEVKREIKANRLVLFTGTSCQISGLSLYLGNTYPNLITADIICHGVPTPKLWDEYLKYHKAKSRAQIIGTSFRDKHHGWLNFSMVIEFEMGRYTEKSSG